MALTDSDIALKRTKLTSEQIKEKEIVYSEMIYHVLELT